MKTIIVKLEVESDAKDADLRESICSILSGVEERHISHEVMPDKTERLRHDVRFRIACATSGNCRVDSGH